MAGMADPTKVTAAVTDGRTSQDVGSEARQQLQDKYGSKTSAQLISGTDFEALKAQQGLHVVGVTGFSGQWGQSKIDADPAIKADYEAGTAALEKHLVALSAKHGDKLVLSSGATMEGVPKIIYDVCDRLGITAMGVTSEKAFDYPLGKMKYLVVEGTDWGQESATFLRTSDEILMLGGGGQAKKEAIAASIEGKPVTIFQGYKGTADQLTASDVANATFVAR
jgi:hypothetical protein